MKLHYFEYVSEKYSLGSATLQTTILHGKIHMALKSYRMTQHDYHTTVPSRKFTVQSGYNDRRPPRRWHNTMKIIQIKIRFTQPKIIPNILFTNNIHFFSWVTKLTAYNFTKACCSKKEPLMSQFREVTYNEFSNIPTFSKLW